MNAIPTTEKKKTKTKYLVDTIGIITDMIRETPDTHTLRIRTPYLSDDQRPFRFKPGQFVMVRPFIEQHDKVIPRAYSISSSPIRSKRKDGYFDLTVRQTETPTVSKWLNDRKIGEEIPFRGPYGNFIWNEKDLNCQEVFMLGGGSGITPMKCIMEYIHDKQLPNKIELLYSCRTYEDIIFEKELPLLAQNCKDARLEITLSREPPDSDWKGRRGRFGKEDIRKGLNDRNFDLARTTFYLCGTPQFVTGMIDNLKELGIDPSRIKNEKWD